MSPPKTHKNLLDTYQLLTPAIVRYFWWSLTRPQSFIPFSQATYKLSSIGVEVHGRCDLEYIGMDFIKWYIGGQATKACRVYAVALRKHAENGILCNNQIFNCMQNDMKDRAVFLLHFNLIIKLENRMKFYHNTNQYCTEVIQKKNPNIL